MSAQQNASHLQTSKFQTYMKCLFFKSRNKNISFHLFDDIIKNTFHSDFYFLPKNYMSKKRDDLKMPSNGSPSFNDGCILGNVSYFIITTTKATVCLCV